MHARCDFAAQAFASNSAVRTSGRKAVVASAKPTRGWTGGEGGATDLDKWYGEWPYAVKAMGWHVGEDELE